MPAGQRRYTHEQVKETCLHYHAYDSPNFAKHIQDLSAEVSGSKEPGYTLTARGLASATELVKEMIATKKQTEKGEVHKPMRGGWLPPR